MALQLVSELSPVERIRNALASEPEVVLAGCAGTGKTTLVRQLIDAPGVVLCAPTNKARLRLQQVTGKPALTVHSLVYGKPIERWIKADGEPCKGWTDEHGVTHSEPGCPGCTCKSELGFQEGKDIEDAQLVIVDEASMIGTATASAVRRAADRHGFTILWVGDPAQLPPVDDTPGVDLCHPDVLLDTVHRAQGGILAIATEIRAARSFEDLAAIVAKASAGAFPDVRVYDVGLGGLADWRAARSSRMAITHTNKARVSLNRWTRDALGWTSTLQRADRLLVRNNVHGLVANGEILVVLESLGRVEPFEVVKVRLDGDPSAPVFTVAIAAEHLDAEKPDEFGRDAPRLGKALRELAAVRHGAGCTSTQPGPFDDGCTDACKPGPLAGVKLINAMRGFAITCHASQGSEADEVAVHWTPRSHRNRFPDAQSWLYTACTRARKSLSIWLGS